MASSRFVFPWALGPTTTVRPAGTSRETWEWLRKSRASNHSNRTGRSPGRSPDGSGETDRHDQIHEGLLFAPDHGRLQPVAHLDLDTVARGAAQPVDEVVRIERRRQVVALELRLDAERRLS